ncbi:FG-GAP and VCBS repeat-containing protein [Streptomyces sp. NPDC048002]|uniref:FG-GAP repeat domain-containing protein n=1 Tax=Streptomyces sp. NPDC048002 TaxID=3154344 RepID=UPI0033E467F9
MSPARWTIAVAAAVALALGGLLVLPALLRDSASVTAVHRAPDFDGDGRGDLVMPDQDGRVDGLNQAGYVAVAYGPEPGRTPKTQVITEDSAGVPGRAGAHEYFGGGCVWWDFDDDGYTDLVVGAAGRASVVWGGPEGLSGGTVLVAGMSEALTGQLVVGDFDGDGRQDVAAEGWIAYGPLTRTGGAARTERIHLDTGEHAVQEAEEEYWKTYDIAAGDVDGDGFTDLLAVASVDHDGEPGDALLLFLRGSSAGLKAPVTVRKGESGDRPDNVGREIETGDLNSDGYDDMVFGDWSGTGSVKVVLGSAAGPDPDRIRTVDQKSSAVPGPRTGSGFASSVAVGDVDGDGNLDVAVGDPYARVGKQQRAGRVVVLKGDGAGKLTAPGAQSVHHALPGVPLEGTSFSAWHLALLDTDFDGRTDVVVGTNPWGAHPDGYCVLPGTREGITGTGSYCIAVPEPGR